MVRSEPPPLRIRPVELADGPLIEEYASDPRIAATSHVPHPYPSGGGQVFAARAVDAWRGGTERPFAVVHGEAFVGLVNLMAVNRQLARAQIGYWIGVPHWGKGIATGAVRLVVRAAFAEFGLEQLGAGCLAENPASARVLEKAGFTEGASFPYKGPDRRFIGKTIRTSTLRAPDGSAAAGEDKA